MTVHVLELPGYTPEEARTTGDDMPEGLFVFRWLMSAFSAKRADPLSGAAKPMIRLGTDPERIDSAMALLEQFEDLRIEVRADSGQVSYKLRPEGGHFALDAKTVTLLQEYWDAFAGEFLGASSDIRTLKRVNAALDRLKDTKLKPAEYAKKYGTPEPAGDGEAEKASRPRSTSRRGGGGSRAAGTS